MTRDAFDALDMAHFDVMDELIETQPPPLELRSALLDSLSKEPSYIAYSRRLAQFFDVEQRLVEIALQTFRDRSSWTPFEGGGRMMPFAGGAHVHGAYLGFVEFDAGLQYQLHEHRGIELQFVLSGTLTESSGRTFLPGDCMVSDSGTSHAFEIGAENCIIALIRHGRIRMK